MEEASRVISGGHTSQGLPTSQRGHVLCWNVGAGWRLARVPFSVSPHSPTLALSRLSAPECSQDPGVACHLPGPWDVVSAAGCRGRPSSTALCRFVCP